MTTTILVTGGTGNLGGHVVRRLRAAGRDVRVLSRRTGDGLVTGDLATGAGIDAAVAGVGTVIHCAGEQKGDEAKAGTLVRAASRAGVGHLVFISVVGADRMPVRSAVDRAMFGYFTAKLGAERVIAESGIPWTTLRATQFHDLMLTTVRAMAKLPVIPVPGFRIQSVAADEVAARLVELADGPPAGLVPDVGGPQVLAMRDMLRSYLRARGAHRVLVRAPVPGAAARAYRAGANLTPDHAVGRRTWEEFLAAVG